MTVEHHDVHLGDAVQMTAMRALLAVSGKPSLAPEDRPATDEMMAKIAASDGVTFEADEIAGVGGWWCRPPNADPGRAILYLHGGAYVLGSAWAYRGFAGQIAAASRTATFAPDYALAPERRFPAAFDDARSVYGGLVERGIDRIALCGDSAGGGLTLALLLALSREERAPVAAVAMSPWTDLSCSGQSMETRAARDPLLSREALQGAARLYLGDADPGDPRASALRGDLDAAPPVMIHVGEDEVLLDDTLRFAERADTAGRECRAHVWKGMVHVFPANASLTAATEAMETIGAFLRTHLEGGTAR